jgi:quinol monooxygenase YgiN
MSVKITAILVAKPGKAGELRALLDTMLAPSRAEAGNLRYDLWQDQADPNRFVLDELYTDSAAIAAHRASAHFQSYLSKIGALAERSAFMLDPVDLGDEN